mmetsp:Transcript_20139/g.59643  ORF Transcript_20139/g.59643 Transcript_20139/m.59643 type:complete len:338 (-) Transcript_20139:477-1490(-)
MLNTGWVRGAQGEVGDRGWAAAEARSEGGDCTPNPRDGGECCPSHSAARAPTPPGWVRPPPPFPPRVHAAGAAAQSPPSPPPAFFFLLFFFFFFATSVASSATSASSVSDFSEFATGGGELVVRATLPDGSSATVNLTCATNSLSFSYSTGYSTKRLCLTHSTTPIRHARSSPARSVKGSVGKRAFTSEKKAREAFILSEYFSSRSRLKTVHLFSPTFGLPSPVDIAMSIEKTSPFSIVTSLGLFSSFTLLTIILFASMTCFFIWCDRTPSSGVQPYASATLAIMSVTSVFLHPSLNILCASSDAVHAAIIASAFLPVTGGAAASAVQTCVWATTPM